LPC
jgi:hypothetical protein